MSNVHHDAWCAIALHYQRLAITRASEGPSIKLACLVLADYCASLWADQRGPSLAMVALAEHIVGEGVDTVVADELRRLAAAEKDALS